MQLGKNAIMPVRRNSIILRCAGGSHL